MDKIIEGAVELLAKKRGHNVLSNTCVLCNGDANEFKDELSKKEYQISHLCQGCQDDVFGVEA